MFTIAQDANVNFHRCEVSQMAVRKFKRIWYSFCLL